MQAETDWTQKIHNEIPLTQAMAINITKLTESQIQLQAPLHCNINGHKTAFAGSIYTLGITAGWTLLSYVANDKGLSTSVVAGSANIKYQQPLKEELYAQCELQTDECVANWSNCWVRDKHAKQTLQIRIGTQYQTAAIVDSLFFLMKV